MWPWFAKNTTDVASPCVHCFQEASSCVSVFLVYTHVRYATYYIICREFYKTKAKEGVLFTALRDEIQS